MGPEGHNPQVPHLSRHIKPPEGALETYVITWRFSCPLPPREEGEPLSPHYLLPILISQVSLPVYCKSLERRVEVNPSLAGDVLNIIVTAQFTAPPQDAGWSVVAPIFLAGYSDFQGPFNQAREDFLETERVAKREAVITRMFPQEIALAFQARRVSLDDIQFWVERKKAEENPLYFDDFLRVFYPIKESLSVFLPFLFEPLAQFIAKRYLILITELNQLEAFYQLVFDLSQQSRPFFAAFLREIKGRLRLDFFFFILSKTPEYQRKELCVLLLYYLQRPVLAQIAPQDFTLSRHGLLGRRVELLLSLSPSQQYALFQGDRAFRDINPVKDICSLVAFLKAESNAAKLRLALLFYFCFFCNASTVQNYSAILGLLKEDGVSSDRLFQRLQAVVPYGLAITVLAGGGEVVDYAVSWNEIFHSSLQQVVSSAASLFAPPPELAPPDFSPFPGMNAPGS